jgi:hypothetical protein
LIAIRVETTYIPISRSLSGLGPKGEPNVLIAAESEMTDLLRLLKLIWQPDLSMLAIRVEPDESNFIIVDLLIVEYLLEELITS